jgi:hypothetical protein
MDWMGELWKYRMEEEMEIKSEDRKERKIKGREM